VAIRVTAFSPAFFCPRILNLRVPTALQHV
jgi:hypothetical protein